MTYFDIHTHNINKEKDVVSIVSAPWAEGENFYNIGIHPWHINESYHEKLKHIDSIADKPNILAIGEIGLDKVCKTDFELQKEVFTKQIALAEKHHKPVIIHCVRAFEEVLALIKNVSVPVVIHGFNKGAELARQLTEKDFYLSFGKSLFDKNTKSIGALEETPLFQIFLETDDSDFDIKDIYKRAAEIKDMDIEVLAGQIEQNFKKVFRNNGIG
ncbi:MAG: TatD family hydrolase [Lentisphaerota bacterium]